MIRLVFTQQKHDRRRNRYFAESKLAELSSPRVDKSEAKASCIWNILHKLSNLCQYACVSGSQSCGESYLPAGCQIPAFPLLASSAAAQRDLASIAITLASITPGQDLLPRPTIMPAAKNASKKKNDKEGLAVKKTVKTKAAPKPKKEKKPKAPKPKAAPKKKVIFFSLFNSNPFSCPGCSGITWISSHFYHQFQFIVVTLCLKAMNKRFVLVYCSSFKNMYVASRLASLLR